MVIIINYYYLFILLTILFIFAIPLDLLFFLAINVLFLPCNNALDLLLIFRCKDKTDRVERVEESDGAGLEAL